MNDYYIVYLDKQSIKLHELIFNWAARSGFLSFQSRHRVETLSLQYKNLFDNKKAIIDGPGTLETIKDIIKEPIVWTNRDFIPISWIIEIKTPEGKLLERIIKKSLQDLIEITPNKDINPGVLAWAETGRPGDEALFYNKAANTITRAYIQAED